MTTVVKSFPELFSVMSLAAAAAKVAVFPAPFAVIAPLWVIAPLAVTFRLPETVEAPRPIVLASTSVTLFPLVIVTVVKSFPELSRVMSLAGRTAKVAVFPTPLAVNGPPDWVIAPPPRGVVFTETLPPTLTAPAKSNPPCVIHPVVTVRSPAIVEAPSAN